MGELKEQTVSGVKWLMGASVLQKIVSFGTTIIIARRLGPSIYGLFAFAMVVVTSFELFKSLGVDAALIRRKEDYPQAADTAFLIIPSLGIFLFLVLNLSASFIGRFLNNMDLVPIIRILGIIFVISCFSKVPNITLERAMTFKFLSIADFTCTIIFSITAIVCTFLGLEVWSLVFAYILKMLVFMVMVWVKSGWRPKFVFDKGLAKEMLHFGKFVFLSSILWFLKMNLDNLLVGKILGTAMLGFYAVAFNIANFGSDYFGGQIHRVTYPAYSKLEGNLEGLQNAFLKVFKYMSLFAIPLGVGTFLIGGDFLSLAYGHKWEGAVGVLKILAWAGIFNTLPVSAMGVFLAKNNPKQGLIITTIQVTIFFIFITPAARIFGVTGVGYVVMLASLLSCIYAFYQVQKLLNLRINQMFASLKPALISSSLMAMVIIIFKKMLSFGLFSSLEHFRFFLLFIIAASIYMYSLSRFEKTVFREMREMIF
ncbi:MAG: lipopolysaccharide biosynthesis protein [bacterium]|nr:lipopolysaccharide biosynthesis protein [bacterium]MDD5757168.1 lipopolysaccharide biosynthesis protein [bacterium]